MKKYAFAQHYFAKILSRSHTLNRRVIELREIVNIYKEDVNEKGK